MSEKIAFLLDHSPSWWSSLNSCQLHLCRALKNRNVESVVVYSDMSNGQEVSRVFSEYGVETLAVNYWEGRFRYYQELGRLIDQYGITTVHSEFFNYFSPVPWFARLCGARHILFTEYTSGLWQPKWWAAGMVRLRGQIACWPVERVVAVSDFIKERLIEAGVPPDKIVRAYLGVDSGRFTPDPGGRERLAEQCPFEPEDVILVAVTSFLPWKRVPVTVEACGLLRQRGIPVRLFLCGDGPQRGHLEEIAHRLNITDCVHFLGHRPNVEEVLQGSDILVHASVGEAFAWALLEGMACGLPVVGSRSGGIAEAVVDGITGILAEPLDPTSFANALEKLAVDEKLRKKMGAAARKRVEEKFTLEIYTANMLPLYQSLWTER